ncbi:phage N-6-adenine-methyltransferase [Gibbsiella quercinecans]|uniref:phage N-6-adenine-methyltransferase n=1 Tax=Gibbsiella quercinecans TaxID=929813 RepID=UPI00243006F5|nr:phage N-6-adenine-methyltransferase [Gibbsiella quercinecans]
MIDENDKDTGSVFMTFEEMEHENFQLMGLANASHYQAVLPCKHYKITGHRYNNTTTPDIVRDEWSTDRSLVEYMVGRYGPYDLDAAADEGNRVCEKFYNERTNCLKRWWGRNKHVWLNPPYSLPDPFVLKAIEQMEHGNQIDILLPSDNSTAWFRDAQKAAAEIIWIVADTDEREGELVCRSGRLAFTNALTGKPVGSNNKGSVIFIMRTLKPGEVQQTHYIPVSEICPSLTKKKLRKRAI